MTEALLKDVLKEAQEKEQVGLLIWPFWRMWDDIGFEIKPGDKDYDTILNAIMQGEEGSIVVNKGFVNFRIVAVPVQKLLDSEEDFNRILRKCTGDGPVTLLPLNELADCC